MSAIIREMIEERELRALTGARCLTCHLPLPIGAFYWRRNGVLEKKCKKCRNRSMILHRNHELERKRDRARRAAPDYPAKCKARRAVAAAIRRGVLRMPEACEKCGTPGKVQAHHWDLGNPVAVRWLCKACRAEANRGGAKI